MPFVNYVKEHTAFIEYAADNGLRPNEILVWEALFHIMNQRANGNYWPDGFIRVKNDRLLTYAPIGFDSLSRARNALAQRGLISYRPGKRNTDIPMYEMRYLTATSCQQPSDTQDDEPVYPQRRECCPQFADNMRGNMRDNIGDNMLDNIGGNIGDQYININENNKHNETDFFDDDEDDDDGKERVREAGEAEIDPMMRAQRSAASAIRLYFGREPTTEEARQLGVKSIQLGFSSEMLVKAIQIAATHGARSPVGYTLRILREWMSEYITTPDEADEYQVMKDASENRILPGGYNEAWNMNEARERRRKLHAAQGGSRNGRSAAPDI